MSLKHEWKFKRTREEVLQGAQKQLDHHTTRQIFWNNKKQEIVEDIRAKGLEVSENELEMYTNNAAGYNASLAGGRGYGRAPQVVVKPEFQEQLNTCSNKISQHTNLVDQYRGWVAFLQSPGPMEVELQIEDHLFFFKDCG